MRFEGAVIGESLVSSGEVNCARIMLKLGSSSGAIYATGESGAITEKQPLELVHHDERYETFAIETAAHS